MEPAHQIILSFVIYLIAVFFFSIIAYNFFAEDFPTKACTSLIACYIIIIDQTFKSNGGLAGYLTLPYSTEAGWSGSRLIYDYLYAFFVILLFVNMISGVIIDKFGDIREKTEEMEADKESKCFICGKPREICDIESKTGFKVHISVYYIFFIF